MKDAVIVHIKDLTPDPKNARKHGPRNVGTIERALNEVGAARSIVVDEDGMILAGNATVEAAAAAGIERVQVVDTDGETIIAVRRSGLTPEQKVKLALYDNRAAELADGWDVEKLLEAANEGIDLSGMWRQDELDALLAEATKEAKAAQEDPGPQIDKAEELRVKWGTALGQVWELGEHRLAVGDCTDKAVVEAVMRGERLRLFVTDPPYGVGYADKNKYLNAVAKGNRIQTPIENDHLNAVDMQAVWFAAFRTALDVADDGCPYYVNAPQGGDHMTMMMMLDKAGWLVRHELIWLKNNHVLGRADYQYKHEPILYGWKPGSHKFYGDRSQFSVWGIDKPTNSDLHPTTKPVELVEHALSNSSLTGEIVGDWFLGSGTTLIACEKLGRKGRGIELSPGYCGVTLQRWHEMTGLEPRLVTP